ncbi:hypothetical protein VTL71DRAFT_14723 [Oculimacula yallundae]|uniref:Heterokaryon incompatibility domain-containing protein n=1 Tax=Oculimacula yallundae TaxID=86028 RepID=A0ABR4CLA4_9HELO
MNAEAAGFTTVQAESNESIRSEDYGSSTTSDQELCDRCKELPWLELFACPEPSLLGPIWTRDFSRDGIKWMIQTKSVAALRESPGCNFCRVLLAIFDSEPRSNSVISEGSLLAILRRSSLPFAANHVLKSSNMAIPISVEFSNVQPTADLYSKLSWRTGDTSFLSITSSWYLAAGPDHDFTRHQSFCYSPKEANTLEFQSLQGWIKACDASHTCFVKEGPAEAYEMNLTCIDVHEEKLVDLQGHEDYIALSYVWGADSNADDKTMQDDDFRFDRLPQTIRDAICVVQSMGQRLLWVDRYCINQLDSETRRQQIQNMDLVYGRAYLTIVNLHGQDSNAGIPGLRIDTRDLYTYRF